MRECKNGTGDEEEGFRKSRDRGREGERDRERWEATVGEIEGEGGDGRRRRERGGGGRLMGPIGESAARNQWKLSEANTNEVPEWERWSQQDNQDYTFGTYKTSIGIFLCLQPTKLTT